MIITGIDLTRGFTIKGQLRPPAKPTNVYATALSNISANVTFVCLDNGDSAIIGYTAITYPGNVITNIFDSNTSNITVTGLTPATRYTFSVIANNGEAPSSNSDITNMITTWDVPGAPIGQIFRLSNTTANVYYTLSSNIGNTSLIALIVQSNTGTILGKTHSVYSESTGNVTITGLQSNTNQTLQIYANNLVGIGAITSLPQFVTSLIPDAPTILYVNPTSGTTANIVFNAPENIGSGITSYSGNANGISYATISQSGSGNLLISGLSRNTNYSVTLVATSLGGNSLPSSSNTATTWTVPDAPTIAYVDIPYTSSNANIVFIAPAFNGGAPIIRYTANANGIIYSAVSQAGSGNITIPGLTLARDYRFTVVAENLVGNSIPSTAVFKSTTELSGQAAYITPGTYSWVAPATTSRVSAVAVGGGAGGACDGFLVSQGGGGGGLGWRNNIAVTGGQSYTVVVGSQGIGSVSYGTATRGGNSYFISNVTLFGGGGEKNTAPGAAGPGGSYVGDGGGYGGQGGTPATSYKGAGGGGAGGYTANGGAGGGYLTAGSPSTGGGGGGGGGCITAPNGGAGGGGGGVGIFGLGSNGTGGPGTAQPQGGLAGSSGNSGGVGTNSPGGIGGYGGNIGGGGGGAAKNFNNETAGSGGTGAVRLIWGGTPAGNVRLFPQTNTNDV